MKRRGISPLIATVLLIGFTIVLAAAIMLWWVGTTKEFIDKEGATQAAQMRCATSTSLDIVSCSNNEVVIKNIGTETITAVIVRDPTGGEPETYEVDLDSGEEDEMGAPNNRVQVIPAILEDGVLVSCTNQLVESGCTA